MTGVVYAIRYGPDGPIKIGRTKDLEARLRSLQTACPRPLEVLKTFPYARGLEKLIHVAFAAYRMEGEWFAADPEVLRRLAEEDFILKTPPRAVLEVVALQSLGQSRSEIADTLGCTPQWVSKLAKEALTFNLGVDTPWSKLKSGGNMANNPNITRVIDAAGGKAELARTWGISYQAIDKFERQGWLPLERARAAADAYGIPLRDLVRPDIRSAIDSQPSA